MRICVSLVSTFACIIQFVTKSLLSVQTCCFHCFLRRGKWRIFGLTADRNWKTLNTSDRRRSLVAAVPMQATVTVSQCERGDDRGDVGGRLRMVYEVAACHLYHLNRRLHVAAAGECLS